MIILNGKKFAENDSEFTNSLFDPTGTCVGYARRNSKSVTLMNHHKEKIGVINKHGVLACATKLSNGKYWYSHADIDLIGRYSSYSQKVKECNALI